MFRNNYSNSSESRGIENIHNQNEKKNNTQNSPNMVYGSEVLTTSTGSVVDNDQTSLTTEKLAKTVMDDVHLMEKLTHFNRERIPERVVHAKGAGAYGKFVVNNEMSRYTSAKLFEKQGKETPVFVRFSTVGGERGSADTARDPRGFAVKFYTEDGNYDIVGNDTPVFFIRDAIKFPDFIHTQKRNPITNLPDINAMWDFFSLTPESMHQLLRLMSDNGTPDGFRFMNGHGNHAFMWYKNSKEYVWVKYHFISVQGLKNLNAMEATRAAGENPNYSTQDLYDSIRSGNYPSWDLCVQILTPEQAANYKFDIFDVTKIVYEEDYPMIPIGRMTLNRIPDDFFNEVEQAAFCPGNFVTGIAASPDKMLNARAVMYSDAQRYRVGVNVNQLPVNKPLRPSTSYQRDGFMRTGDKKPFPNYFPNSFGGPVPNPDVTPPSISVCGEIARFNEKVTAIDFEQPRRYYIELGSVGQEHLVSNICDSLKNALTNIQYRKCAVFYLTEKTFANKVALRLGLNMNTVAGLAAMSQDERAIATKSV